MNFSETDVTIVGAGPAGLMCAYLGQLCGLRTRIFDRSTEPLQTGRADALNARSLQLLEVVDLLKHLLPKGKVCKTSSVWGQGRFISRESSWWDNLQGCRHKYFLMLGQAHVEQLLDLKLAEMGSPVERKREVLGVRVTHDLCQATLDNGEIVQSKYLIGADGAHSLVRTMLNVSFNTVRPQINWVVIDGIIETDFIKVPEIIIFQSETADVAWIPREGLLDRFYVRMDSKDDDLNQVIAKINRAMSPHTLRFKEIIWHSSFSVKEAVAEQFSIQDRLFLVGDAAHVHSVNGGQGLNTGVGDAFNLMWKLSAVVKRGVDPQVLKTYESERKPIAESVLASSGELVRSTKTSQTGTHAKDYVSIVKKRAGNITGMGLRYGDHGLSGCRLYDFQIKHGDDSSWIYSHLEYTQVSLLIFGEREVEVTLPSFVKVLQIFPTERSSRVWAENAPYRDQAILVRPDATIEQVWRLEDVSFIGSQLRI